MHPGKRDAFFFGGDGGISTRFASLDCFRQPKILRLRFVFLGRQVLTRWVLILTKIKNSPPKRRTVFLAEMVGFEPTCPAKDKTISSRSCYDHFDTSPYLSVCKNWKVSKWSFAHGVARA